MHSLLSDLFARFRTEECGTRIATRKLRKQAMNHCLTAVGDITLHEFGYAEARRLQRYLVESPARNAVTANTYLRMLEPVFELACYQGDLAENPLRAIRRLREPKKRIETYSRAEAEALVAACESMRHRATTRAWRVRILLALCAGLRRGECLNLHVGDIDFEAGWIWVRAKAERPESWAWSVKDYEDRKVPLPEILADTLAEAIAELPAGQPYVALTPRRYRGCQRHRQAGTWSEELACLPDQNFRQPFLRLCGRAGVTNKTFHALRATCITWWLQDGVPAQEVRDLAGHSDLETTMKYYAAVRSDYVHRAAATTNERIKRSQIGATGLEPATS